MNVVLFTDLRFVTTPTPTGVGKHIVEMASGIADAPGCTLRIAASSDQLSCVPACVESARLPPSKVIPLPKRWKPAEAIWTVTRRPFMDGFFPDADWVYCPKNDFIPLKHTRFAATIHGVRELDPHVSQPATLAAGLRRARLRLSYTRITRQARLLLTVSEFLKAQIVEWFKVDPARIVVVGNGVEDCFFDSSATQTTSPDDGSPFVLCVGGLNDSDGGDRVIALARILRDRRADLRVCVAGLDHDASLKRLAESLPNITLLGYVPAERLAVLMRRAVALFYPPTYETFGIVGPEALAAGCPIVTCGGSALPEILGDTALYVSPHDPGDAADAIRKVTDDAVLRSTLIRRGQERAADYRWDRCVARVVKALHEFL